MSNYKTIEEMEKFNLKMNRKEVREDIDRREIEVSELLVAKEHLHGFYYTEENRGREPIKALGSEIQRKEKVLSYLKDFLKKDFLKINSKFMAFAVDLNKNGSSISNWIDRLGIEDEIINKEIINKVKPFLLFYEELALVPHKHDDL